MVEAPIFWTRPPSVGRPRLLAGFPLCWSGHHSVSRGTTLLVEAPLCWSGHHSVGRGTTLSDWGPPQVPIATGRYWLMELTQDISAAARSGELMKRFASRPTSGSRQPGFDRDPCKSEPNVLSSFLSLVCRFSRLRSESVQPDLAYCVHNIAHCAVWFVDIAV